MIARSPSCSVSSKTDTRLHLASVRATAVYAQATLLPVSSTRSRYSDATTVLDEIDNNQSENY
ncbi:MAG: hypothetical protein M3P41_13415 [Actinomycetota bacterium]|nr:hypothetical protein [Actinomycetota bacterium]